MGGGGIIIIRQKVRDSGNLDQVKDCLSPAKRAHLESILAKDVADWTSEDAHFVLRAVAKALDEDC